MSNERIPALWFDREGCGPDWLALELHDFKAEKDGQIPASLGLLLRAGELVLLSSGRAMVDGGLMMDRASAAELHRRIGEWLEKTPPADRKG